MGGFMSYLSAQAAQPAAHSLSDGFSLLIHASLVGIFLMLLTWWVSSRLGEGRKQGGRDILITSSNVLLLCVGMAAVMILVADNLARAFAIGAAIALVRFRIKMAGRFIGIALFYGVLTGMACGVSRVDIAWEVALIFAVLLNGVLALRELVSRRARREPAPAAAPVLPIDRAAS
jgi:hypothetical protein